MDDVDTLIFLTTELLIRVVPAVDMNLAVLFSNVTPLIVAFESAPIYTNAPPLEEAVLFTIVTFSITRLPVHICSTDGL